MPMIKDVYYVNKIQLNQSKFIDNLKRYLLDVLKQAEDVLIEAIKIEMAEIPSGTNYDDGFPWVSDMQKDVQVLSEEITDQYVKAVVGLPYGDGEGSGDYRFLRAMTVAYGAGSSSIYNGTPLRSKPGEFVYGKDFAALHLSNAIVVKYLPPSMNTKGNDFINNACKQIERVYKDIIEKALLDIPNEVYVTAVEVKRGR